MGFRHFAIAAACLAALTVPALAADKTITVLHVSDNAAQKAIWDQIANDYNAEHKGVKVQFKYLENEAFKAKLPTMLQSEDSRPELFYSWGGGVMQAQDKAGFLKDIAKDVAPAVEQLRTGIVRLQHGRQLRLEGLVLQILELDLHAGMRGVIVLGGLVPNRLLRRVFADMKDGDMPLCVGWGAQGGDAGRKERELAKFHGLPPEGRGSGCFFRVAN